MGGRRLALAFDDPASRFLPWIVSLMVFFAALAVAGVLALEAAAARWRADDRSALTVELPAGAPLAPALRVLEATPGVVAVRPLAREELVALIEPWLPGAAIPPELALPQMIEATVDELVGLDTEALAERLAAAVAGARLDDHALERRRLVAAARGLEGIALAVVAVTAVTAVGVVVFTTRSSLAVHHDTIEVLHLIGASDGFIAGRFAAAALVRGLAGGLLGLVPAGAALWAVGRLLDGLALAGLPRLGFGFEEAASIAAVPLGAALIAMLTARLTVLRALARLP